jgi:NAD-dependent dihydropyrimidine dehydrogenase PreA subunit
MQGGGAAALTREHEQSVFIRIDVEPSIAEDVTLAAKLTEVCPVDIYSQNEDGSLRIVEENLDECVLCYLCVEAAPEGTVRVVKLYGEA